MGKKNKNASDKSGANPGWSNDQLGENASNVTTPEKYNNAKTNKKSK